MNPTSAQACHSYSHWLASTVTIKEVVSVVGTKISTQRESMLQKCSKRLDMACMEKGPQHRKLWIGQRKITAQEAEVNSRGYSPQPSSLTSLGKPHRVVPLVLQNLGHYLYGFRKVKYNHVSLPHSLSLSHKMSCIQKETKFFRAVDQGTLGEKWTPATELLIRKDTLTVLA